MSVCINKFTCPIFIFFPCNPHSRGNDYHTIFCVESGIVYGWEIVEGRGRLIPMGRPEFDTMSNMKTIGLVI